MVGETGTDEDDPWFRPVWADEDDTAEVGNESGGVRLERPAFGMGELAFRPFGRGGSAALLRALAEAEDALSRLDAATAAAPEPVRDGLAARLAFREAAGWLARADHWVHPLDLCLRDLGLTGSYAAATLAGRTRRALPATIARQAPPAPKSALEEAQVHPLQDLAEVAEDRAIPPALALARGLRRLVASRTWRPLRNAAEATEALRPLAGLPAPIAPEAYADWRANLREASGRLPPLLAGLVGAEHWLAQDPEAGRYAAEAELRAGFLACAALVEVGRLRAVPLPIWTAVPARLGLRQQAPAPFGCSEASAVAFLSLVAEGAREGLRELARLQAAAESGARLVADCDRRSRLPEALAAALRVPALTPKALARVLDVVPQTATTLLGELARGGVVREVTGRRTFRAFTV